MPIIRVSCLPVLEEAKLKTLYEEIASAGAAVKELGLETKDFTVLFPQDMMKFGLGDEVIIEVIGLFDKPERTYKVQKRLAAALGHVVRKHAPKAKLIECFVFPFSNTKQGYWSSRLKKGMRPAC